MSLYADKITTLIRECKAVESRGNKHEKKLPSGARPGSEAQRRANCNLGRKNDRDRDNGCELIESESVDSREMLSRDVERLVEGTKIRTASVEFSNLSKMLALSCLAAGDEATAIRHLIESHAVILKQHIYHRYTKTMVRTEYLKQPQESGLKPAHTEFEPKSVQGSHPLRAKLAEMPEEWYVVQLTAGYKEPYSPDGNDSVLDSTVRLHITVLPTGEQAVRPLCVTVPSPRYGEYQEYDGLREIVKIQKNNKSELEAYYINNRSYWKMREKQNNNMKTAMKELEHSWLREWRILLVADPLEDSSLVAEMRVMIDKLIADDLSVIEVSPRSRWLLRKIATSSCFLTKVEIARAVLHVLPGNEKLANNVILSIHGKLNSVGELRTLKRKTLVMIVDECIDHIPFETMDVLYHHPVTRFPSFHIAYAMYKEHEDTIVAGCKLINRHTEQFGTFIVNPARNLSKMEKRMKLFIDYWLPRWTGKYGREPDENDFEKVLVDKDVLVYSGHGSGIQYLPGEKIERLRVRATVLLFGCSSVKLHSTGGRFPPYGVSNRYLIACRYAISYSFLKKYPRTDFPTGRVAPEPQPKILEARFFVFCVNRGKVEAAPLDTRVRDGWPKFSNRDFSAMNNIQGKRTSSRYASVNSTEAEAPFFLKNLPCVLGMLWEVTDGDIDRMTARFMSDWIPSDPGKSWSDVDVNKWCEGVLKFKTPGTTQPGGESTSEPELLRAVASSKKVCTQHMTSAAIIVRGLPIRLE